MSKIPEPEGQELPRTRAFNKLNVRQRKFLKGKILGKSSRQSALDAGYSKHVAKRADMDLTNKPAMQAAFRELLRQEGISDRLLARTMREGISATRTTFFQSEGKVSDSREVADYAERRQYVELAARFQQLLPDRNDEPQKDAVQVVIQVLGTANVQTGSALAVTGPTSGEEPNVQVTQRAVKEEV